MMTAEEAKKFSKETKISRIEDKLNFMIKETALRFCYLDVATEGEIQFVNSLKDLGYKVESHTDKISRISW